MGTLLLILLAVIAVAIVLAIIEAIFWLAVIVLVGIAAAVAWRRYNGRSIGPTTT